MWDHSFQKELEPGEQVTFEKGGDKESRKSSRSEMSLHGLLQNWRVGEKGVLEPSTNPGE